MVEETEFEGMQSKMGIPLDVIDNIIADLNANEDLRRLFGEPVSKNLVIAAVKLSSGEVDLRVEDAGAVNLTKEQSDRFVEVLNSIIKANSL
jgi:hypothetical protein